MSKSYYSKFLEAADYLKLVDDTKKTYSYQNFSARPFIINYNWAVMQHDSGGMLELTHMGLIDHLHHLIKYEQLENDKNIEFFGDKEEAIIDLYNNEDNLSELFHMRNSRHCRIWLDSNLVACWDESSDFTSDNISPLRSIITKYGSIKTVKIVPQELDKGEYAEYYNWDEFMQATSLSHDYDRKQAELKRNAHMMDGNLKKEILGFKPNTKNVDKFADYYQANESAILESPDRFEHSVLGNECDFHDSTSLSFIFTKDGNGVVSHGQTHENMQNTLFYLKINKDKDLFVEELPNHSPEYYDSFVGRMNFIGNKQKVIDALGEPTEAQDDELWEAHVRNPKNLEKFTVGRLFRGCSGVSFWNSHFQLTSPVKNAILKLIKHLGLDPEKFDFEFNKNYSLFDSREATFEKLSYEDFLKDNEINNDKKTEDDNQEQIKRMLHTAEPAVKKFIKKGSDKPYSPKKKDVPWEWKYLVRQESTMQENFKYYAFDWDDNLLFMPTEITVINSSNKPVNITTGEFAILKETLFSEGVAYHNDNVIVDVAEDGFERFRHTHDDLFIKESLDAPIGPAWDDFVEAVNNGKIFSIITARGHSPEAIQEAIRQMVISEKSGLSYYNCIDSLKDLHENSISKKNYTDEELFERYLNKLCKYYPITYLHEEYMGKCSEYKEQALHEFCEHVESAFGNLHPEFKDRVSNNFVIGFSDDDKENVEHITEKFQNTNVSVYDTSSGKKVKSYYQKWKNS